MRVKTCGCAGLRGPRTLMAVRGFGGLPTVLSLLRQGSGPFGLGASGFAAYLEVHG